MSRPLVVLASIALLGYTRLACATHEPSPGEPIEYDGGLSPGVPASGSIGWSSPIDGYDWFCFNVTAGQTVSITVTRTSGDIVPNLGLLEGVADDGDPWTVLPLLANTANQSSPTATLTYTPSFTGPVTLWVSTWFFESGGNYAVTMTGGDAASSCAPVDSTVSCEGGGPYVSSCRSAQIDDASVTDSTGGPVDYFWSSSDPMVTLAPDAGTVPPGKPNRKVPASTASLDPAALPCGVTATLTLSVINSTGVMSSCTAKVKFDDQDLPGISGVPADASVPCQSVPPPAAVSASDNCDPSPTLSFQELVQDGVCPDTYTITRKWSAGDSCGNVRSASQSIAVTDAEPPVLAGLPDDAALSCESVPPPSAVTASDNCDPSPALSFLELVQDGVCPDTYTVTRTWTAADRCGNAESETRTIAVSDVTPPVLAGLPGDGTVSCEAVPPPSAVVASDNCDPSPAFTFQELRQDGSCPDAYTLTRSWTATDRCGNVESATRTLAVEDTTAPMLAGIPADAAAACDLVPAPPAVTAADNCDPAPVLSYLETSTPGSCPDAYTLTRTWTATDRCGNVETAAQSIVVSDMTAPALTGVPADTTETCESVPAPPAVVASDACDPAPVVSFQELRQDGSCADRYTLTRTWSASDRCGNAQAQAQSIAVSDTTLPVLSGVPADATASCDGVPAPPAVSASDNCDPAPALTFQELRQDGSCEDTYTLTRTWSATDRCGNIQAESQSVAVSDTTLPVLSGVPADATASCDGVPAPPAVNASDNCDPAPALSFQELRQDGSCPDAYTLTRTWSATDRCGNTRTASQSIAVADTSAPELSGVPADAAVSCAAVPPPAAVTASDDCDPAPGLSFQETRSDGPCPDTYTLTRTWSATDRCGNLRTASQTVVVTDATAPVLAGVPADATAECDSVPSPPVVTASDDCDLAPIVSFLETRSDGTCADDYTLLRTWTATDRCGNERSASQTVTVVDTTAPVLVGVPADATAECDSVPPPPPVGATDNCDPAPVVSLAEVRTDGSCPDDYTLTRTWTALDRCSNASAASQTVTVQDTTPPEVTALLTPAAPLPPRSAASACSPPFSRQFRVGCAGQDNCDPDPSLAALLKVSNHDVPARNGPCVLRVDEVPVLCGATVEVHLVAPPCPARPPRSPRPASEVRSDGLLVVTGERVVLVVTATDRCGNAASAEWDPTEHPSPLCDERLPDGTCCPPIAFPPPARCDVLPCPLP